MLSRHGTAEGSERKSFSMPVRQNITSIQSMQMETITAYEKLCTTAGIKEKLPMNKTLTRFAREVLFASSSSPTFFVHNAKKTTRLIYVTKTNLQRTKHSR